MATTNTVWIVMSCGELANRVREYCDKGYFGEAKSLVYQIQAFLDKVSSFASERGGHLHINLIDRQVLELDEASAEELPNILEGFRSQASANIACGIGLTFDEASSAMRASIVSDDIEMYDPEDSKFSGVVYYKSENGSEFVLPANLFDPITAPSQKAPAKKIDSKFVSRPNAQQELQLDGQLVQAMAQSMMPQPDPAQQQAQGQQAQGQQQQPRDLMEALHGQPVPGHSPQEEKEKASSEELEQEESDGDEEESGKTNQRLGELLASVKSSLPAIMQLHDKNPEAYKRAMNLVQKLVQVAHNRKKVQKNEIETLTEQLQKAIHLRLPVGSVKGRRKKVLINGKEVWRSVAAGQVKGPEGEAISVKSHNATAAKGGVSNTDTAKGGKDGPV